jgi:hypothetical protein
MSKRKRSPDKEKAFKWRGKRLDAARLLAQGWTEQATADELGLHRRTIAGWKSHPEFRAKYQKLATEIGIATNGEIMRIVQMAVKQRVKDAGIQTGADVLDWLKFGHKVMNPVREVDVKSGGEPIQTNVLVVREIVESDDDQ